MSRRVFILVLAMLLLPLAGAWAQTATTPSSPIASAIDNVTSIVSNWWEGSISAVKKFFYLDESFDDSKTIDDDVVDDDIIDDDTVDDDSVDDDTVDDDTVDDDIVDDDTVDDDTVDDDTTDDDTAGVDEIDVEWLATEPTINGTIQDGEWLDATEVTGYGDVAMTLYLKANADTLYGAIDVTGITSFHSGDLLVIAFDNNNDDLWPTNCVDTTDGQYILLPADPTTLTKIYQPIYGAYQVCSNNPPSALSAFITYSKANMTVEFSVDLSGDELYGAEGETIGITFIVYDQANDDFGYWPNGGSPDDPAKFGDMTYPTAPVDDDTTDDDTTDDDTTDDDTVDDDSVDDDTSDDDTADDDIIDDDTTDDDIIDDDITDDDTIDDDMVDDDDDTIDDDTIDDDTADDDTSDDDVDDDGPLPPGGDDDDDTAGQNYVAPEDDNSSGCGCS